MNIYVSVGWFMLFSTINKMNNLPSFVRAYNSPTKTVLICTFVLILIVLILIYIPWGSQFPWTCLIATRYPFNSNIKNTKQRIFSHIIMRKKTMLININIETNTFFLSIHVLNSLFFVNDNLFYSIWKHLVFYCSLIHLYTSLHIITWTQLEELLREKINLNSLLLS